MRLKTLIFLSRIFLANMANVLEQLELLFLLSPPSEINIKHKYFIVKFLN